MSYFLKRMLLTILSSCHKIFLYKKKISTRKCCQSEFKDWLVRMALTSNCGFFLTKLIVLAIIVNLAFSAEVINGENPREFFAVEGVNSQDVPVIVLSDNYYEKRSNLNKFKSKFKNSKVHFKKLLKFS